MLLMDDTVTRQMRRPAPMLQIRQPMPAGRGRFSDLHTHPKLFSFQSLHFNHYSKKTCHSRIKCRGEEVCLQVFYLNPASSKQAKHSFPKLAAYQNLLEHFRTTHVSGPAPDLEEQELRGSAWKDLFSPGSVSSSAAAHARLVQGGFMQGSTATLGATGLAQREARREIPG